jgi:hypothetical protein
MQAENFLSRKRFLYSPDLSVSSSNNEAKNAYFWYIFCRKSAYGLKDRCTGIESTAADH